MLSARPAETGQCIFGDVIATLNRDLLDRVGHVLHRDLQKAFRHFRGRPVVAGRGFDLGRKCGKLCVNHIAVQRLVLARAEDRREKFRLQLAQHHVAIGDRQRSAPAICRRPRIGTGRFRTDTVAAAIEEADRTTTRRDGMNHHHRRAHAHPRDQRFKGAFIFAVVMRNIRGGATHIER